MINLMYRNVKEMILKLMWNHIGGKYNTLKMKIKSKMQVLLNMLLTILAPYGNSDSIQKGTLSSIQLGN